MMQPEDNEDPEIQAGEPDPGEKQQPEQPLEIAAKGGGPKQTEKAPCRRNIIVVGLISIVVVVGLAVGLSAGLTIDDDGDSPDDSSDNSSDDPAGERFARSRSYMSSICSSSYTEENGNAKCTQECEPASCCDPYLADSCFHNETDGCFSYAKCHVVLSPPIIPDQVNKPKVYDPSPLNLDDICSKEALLENRTACEQACEPALCCYHEAHESCYKNNFLACLDFAACQNLRNDAKVFVAPEYLLEACAPASLTDLTTLTDQEACEEMCSHASCCLDDTDNCLPTDVISCISYVPCGGLVLPALHNNQVPPAPDNFTDVCKLDNIMGSDKSGWEDCRDLCANAACCVDPDLDEFCFISDPFGCLEYGLCALLPFTSGSVPSADDNITTYCSTENLWQADGPQVSQCEKACEDGLCCFEWSDADNCLDEGNAIACLTYASCLLLKATEGIVPPAPDNITSVCSFEHTSTLNGRNECKSLCDGKGSCCYTLNVGENCFLDNLDTCPGYFLCNFVD